MHASEVKARRERFSVEIRKSDNEAIFAHRRRRMLPNNDNDHAPLTARYPISSKAQIAEFMAAKHRLEYSINTFSFEECRAVLSELRFVLSTDPNPELAPLGEFIQSGLLGTLFKLLGATADRKIEEETIWIFANLCAADSDYLVPLIDLGVLELFEKALHSSQSSLIEHALWGISNLLGENPKFQEHMEDLDLWKTIFQVVEQHRSNLKITRTASWLFSNAMRCSPYPTTEQVS